MGELTGNAVEGTLYWVAPDEFARIRNLAMPSVARARLFADLARLNTLYMIARAGSGHIGSSFSSMDMVAWLHLEEMREGDVYFSSKGHDAPGLYAVLTALGKLPADLMHRFRKLGGLPGHPDVGTPGMVTNTGSLGMGISKAKGMVLANRLQHGKSPRIFVMLGDGELQEGQIWESLGGAVNRCLSEITAIVDHNKLQSDTFVKQVSDLGELEAKFASFGWHTVRVDGHDLPRFAETLDGIRGVKKPKLIIADTVKGKGVSFMEHVAMESDAAIYRFHSGAPQAADYTRGAQEIMDRINRTLREARAAELSLETVERPVAAQPAQAPERLIPAYSEALLDVAAGNPKVVALDADLMLDCGLIPFRDKFPERFIECGIAEMDMVSQAGTMALNGLVPVCHSFACFLATRANEQIYNNATERSKVVYMAALAGLVPGGPGHSHQSVRDIAAMASTPGLTLVQPSLAAEVGPLVRWALETNTGSSYLRFVSIPVSVPYELPAGYQVQVGEGWVAKDTGTDVVMIAYGPTMATQAWHALDRIGGGRLAILPWLNRLDHDWLEEVTAGATTVVTIDDHYVEGGQGVMIGAALQRLHFPGRVLHLGVDRIPSSGGNDEVLADHGLDAAGIAKAIGG
ncbi:MAG TPA: transketolase C-terminal domain-containing protein [Geminicoccus sp.]|jgi:transketolase|uniref:transketolase C-terminal domain-containing protein n=1 Tax=Geminicoccus sp. TaxID=2024832 RepID=UPI002E312F74|nr:transketolase C-terminal domain-containing protein [Geminicoccus sp.]HEX2528359.1 transketolase C-terminal domain-containing protein [Geminicoccus sp.]